MNNGHLARGVCGEVDGKNSASNLGHVNERPLSIVANSQVVGVDGLDLVFYVGLGDESSSGSVNAVAILGTSKTDEVVSCCYCQ